MIFRNKFNHHAFRYVRISNLPQKPETGAMKSLQIYGDYKQTATFECSDADLNAIHQMIQYTMKCLTFSGYMVDCPHLERAGYGGDGNSSTMSLQTMYDVAPTFENWEVCRMLVLIRVPVAAVRIGADSLYRLPGERMSTIMIPA